MWIPTHYVCLIVAILLGQSGVLFIYTTIGLLKSNPLPWVMPPPLPPPDLATCRMLLDGPQHLHGMVPHDSVQQPDADTGVSGALSTKVVISTSTVLQTSTIKVSQTLPAALETASPSPQPSSQQSSQNTAISNIADNLKSALGGDHTTIATTTTGLPAATTSGSASSESSNAAPPGSPSKADPSKTADANSSSEGGSSTASPNIPTVTSVTYSTTVVGDPPKPRSTSTSVVVVTPGVNAGHA